MGSLNEDDTQITLSAWVTIQNNTGKTFKNTRLKLMAGDIKLVQAEPSYQLQRKFTEAYAAKPGFEE